MGVSETRPPMSTTTTTTTTTAPTPAAKTKSDLNVSLEPHLIEGLLPLLPVLPQPLHDELTSVLHASDTHTAGGPSRAATPGVRTIPYALLSSISTWTRSQSGQTALHALSPPLQSSAYTMVSLLAGTRTSPERKFPKGAFPAAVDSEEESKRNMSDRRAITALLNALLSIIGSGAATWWAADKLHWKAEWVSTFFYHVLLPFNRCFYTETDCSYRKFSSLSERPWSWPSPKESST